jgi:hypothetical protein
MKKKNNVSLEKFDDQELLTSFESLGVNPSKNGAAFYEDFDAGDYYPTWGHTRPVSVNRGYG